MRCCRKADRCRACAEVGIFFRSFASHSFCSRARDLIKLCILLVAAKPPRGRLLTASNDSSFLSRSLVLFNPESCELIYRIFVHYFLPLHRCFQSLSLLSTAVLQRSQAKNSRGSPPTPTTLPSCAPPTRQFLLAGI